MAISASMVKELRDKTAAGMMDCKKALEECDADLEKAIDWLRQKGLSKAAKRADRATSEGIVGSWLSADAKEACLVEVCCETDFVARGDMFIDLVNKTVDTFVKQGGETFDASAMQDDFASAIGSIGENITIGKSARYKASTEGGIIGLYIHANNKLGVLVELTADKAIDLAKASELTKNIAMQIAAANPLAVDASSLPEADIERERELYRQKSREEGKPENIVEKIAEGAVQKMFKEACLLNQAYIRDEKMSISALLAAQSKELGATLGVARFARLQLGA